MSTIGSCVTLCSIKKPCKVDEGANAIYECNALISALWSGSHRREIDCIAVILVGEVSWGGRPVTLGRQETRQKVPHISFRTNEDLCWWL